MAVSGAGDRLQELKAFDESKAGVKGLVNAGVTKIPRIFSNFDLYESPYANWRDTLFCVMGPDPLDPQELPELVLCCLICMEQSTDISGSKESSAETLMDYDEGRELKALNDTQAGVKGLVDGGVISVLKISVRQRMSLMRTSTIAGPS
ncbi:hypothetical protein RJ639_002012 [Escallonia herrerae]|uniref:Uncharacterized protein n=1 Tax=Escallonia herrerae TaxID=1293975 RepID=A0AA88XIL1_9ASTE|nr:hypothetical protein RJ639_002012 [Escallonia herrerae]